MMIKGMGTFIDAGAIIVAGIIGINFRRFIRDSWQETILKAAGVAVIFMSAASAFSKMLVIDNSGAALGSAGTINAIVSLSAGAFIGELAGIDDLFNRTGDWLMRRSGSESDNRFIEAFVTASLIVIGPMGIMGAINDGIYGDYSIGAAKAVIDFIIVLVMSSGMGKGCAFSCITVMVTQLPITIAASLVGDLLTQQMLDNMSMVGGMLTFCIGLNMIWEGTIKVANLLPALIVTILIAMV